MYENMDNVQKYINKNIYSQAYQTYIPTVILKIYKPKSGPSCRRQVVHPRPQTPQWESVAKPGTPLLIILSVVCKSDIQEVHGNLFTVHYSIRTSVDGNIRGRWITAANTLMCWVVSIVNPFYRELFAWPLSKLSKAAHDGNSAMAWQRLSHRSDLWWLSFSRITMIRVLGVLVRTQQ